MKKFVDAIIKLIKSKEFQKFFVIGVSAFILDFTLLSLIILLFNIPAEEHLQQTAANIISSAIAITYNYAIQRHWAFKSTNKNVAREAGRFVGVHIFNLIVYQSILFTAVNYLLPAWLTKIIVTGVQLVSSFLLYKFFVFKPKAVMTEADIKATLTTGTV